MLVPKQNGHTSASINNNNIGLLKDDACCCSFDQSSCADEEDILFDEHGKIISGALEALIKRMVPTKDYCPNQSYIFALLLNMRTFIAPADLLHKILQQCMFEQNTKGENFTKEGRTRMFSNVFKLCSEWTEHFPYDFRDKTMCQRLKELLNLCPVDCKSNKDVAALLDKLHNKLNNIYCYETILEALKLCYVERTDRNDVMTGLTDLCPKPAVLAEQLTQIELERLNLIGPDDIISCLQNGGLERFDKSSKGNYIPPSINSYIDWFNHLSVIVATEILCCAKKQSRVKIIEYFVEVAKECINIGNFNSLMAIVAGFSLSPIARLKKTWGRVEKSKLEILQHQLDPTANFLSYRATFKAAVWRSDGAKNDTEKIVIPFFALLLKDLALMYSCCEQPMPNGHLNFAMFMQFGEHMQNFVKWKSRQCPFKRNTKVINYLLLTPTLTEKSLMKLSYDCESADQILEKAQYKKLKCDS